MRWLYVWCVWYGLELLISQLFLAAVCMATGFLSLGGAGLGLGGAAARFVLASVCVSFLGTLCVCCRFPSLVYLSSENFILLLQPLDFATRLRQLALGVSLNTGHCSGACGGACSLGDTV